MVPVGFQEQKEGEIGRHGLGDEARTASGQRLPITFSRGGFLAHVCRMDGAFYISFAFRGRSAAIGFNRRLAPKKSMFPSFASRQ